MREDLMLTPLQMEGLKDENYHTNIAVHYLTAAINIVSEPYRLIVANLWRSYPS